MNKLLISSYISLLLKIAGAGLGFIFNILIGRLLGADNAGIYYISIMFLNILSVFGLVGLDNPLLRGTAAESFQNRWDTVKGIHQYALKISARASIFIGILMIGSASTISVFVFKNDKLISPLVLVGLTLVPFNIYKLNIEALKGTRKIIYALCLESLCINPINIFILLLIGNRYGVNGAVITYAISVLLSAFLSIRIWTNTIQDKIQDKIYEYDYKKLLRSGVRFFQLSILSLLFLWSDTFLLGVLKDEASVGIFSACTRLSLLISFMLSASNSVFIPQISALWSQNRVENIKEITTKVARNTTLISLPIAVVMIFYSKNIMSIFGDEYVTGGSVCLSILAIGQLINAITGCGAQILIVTGDENLVRKNMIASGILGILLNTILIPMSGIIGAAIGTGLGIVMLNALNTVVLYRRHRIISLPVIYLK